MVGDSCSAGEKTAEDIIKILSTLSASVKKSFAEINIDFDPTEAIDVAVLYVPVNKNAVIKNKKSPDEKSTENSTEKQKADIVPAVLVRFKKDLYFDFNSSELKDSGSTVTQHFVHDVLAASPGYKNITVVGHADSVGMEKDNLILSKKRSDVTVAELQKQISKTGGSANAFQIESMGVGETQPMEYLEQEKKSQANRRVEIFLSTSSIALHRAEKYIRCLYRNKSGNASGSEAKRADCFTQYMTVQAE
ncbi:Outer membrane protein OmpA [Candidatus Electrothrix marina]|uniref:Outer membrane protein OmpA n=1 Tax=Candidatus Electrothrix marina TaxID=1859130 RepID=A0A444JCI8_9BACT|nr:Outer membrane protein OmpA [Candidatus Electrothrix marina]